jgi:hypothetical protein
VTLFWGEEEKERCFVRTLPGFSSRDQEGEAWKASKKMMLAVVIFKPFVRTSQKTPMNVAGNCNM